jgi:hypothetical protein
VILFSPGRFSVQARKLNENMDPKNKTSTDFIRLGLFPIFRYPNLLILIVLLVYTIAFAGNSILLLLIWLDSHLHTPHVLPAQSAVCCRLGLHL